jgi:hypothetical protein
MLAVPDHIQDPEYWDWTAQDIADRISGLSSAGDGMNIHDYEVETDRLEVRGTHA